MAGKTPTKTPPAKSKAAPAPAEPPSLTEFAAANRLSRKGLNAAIERGEISPSHFVGTPNGRGFASFAAAQEAQAELTAHREAQRDGGRRGTVPAFRPDAAAAVNMENVDFEDPDTWPWDLDGLRSVREHWAAKQTKLKTELASGELVRAADVRNDAFKAFRTAREHILAIPDQVGDDLAAALGTGDSVKVKSVMRERIDRALSDLSRALKTAEEPAS